MHGCFENIDGGFPGQALITLTGAPTLDLWHEEIDGIVDMLLEGEKKQFIMASCTRSTDTKEEELANGIVCGHAYTALSAHTIKHPDLG